MEHTQRIQELVRELFDEGSLADCYLVDIQKAGRAITVFFDCDSGVTLEKCTFLSRQLEKRMDAEGLYDGDYVLEVSSPGVDRPLTLWRQYPRHKGRTLEVTRLDGSSISGKLVDVGLDSLILETGKEQTAEIAFSEIEKSIVQISFNAITS